MTPEKHEEHIEACGRVFVSWAWAAGILIASSLGVASLAWAGSARMTKIDSNIETLQGDVSNLKSMDKKLDVLLERTGR